MHGHMNLKKKNWRYLSIKSRDDYLYGGAIQWDNIWQAEFHIL